MLQIGKSKQWVKQSDNVSHLNVVGEVHVDLHHGKHNLRLDALVVKKLDVLVLAGVPFNKNNKVYTREDQDSVYFADGSYYKLLLLRQ